MFGLHFDQPRYGHFVWCVILLLFALLWLELKRNRVLDRFISAAMQRRLVRRLGLSYRLFAIVLFCLSLCCFVAALMRPQYGASIRKISRMSAQIMICLDVSKSMLAEDVRPNRLERAKAEIVDLLSLMEGDQVGVTAFAGKATVVCPMTTDFGFLRLVLKDIGTHSAGLGGTKLAEPIRMATEGFGEGADISRVILLITDGGDHDSFPLEAAAEAAKRGIRIITVGFGDEAGSTIEITDRRSGETDFVRDENGDPVVSRLDGDLLRRLALDTNGVYIPAGTGALELESIYRKHIVPLTRSMLDSREEVIRNEAYHFVIAAGLALLLLSMLIVGLWSPRTARSIAAQPVPAICLVACLVIVSMGEQAHGQAPKSGNETENLATDEDAPAEQPKAANPRETYNVAVSLLDTDLDLADEQFQIARAEAGADGEVRFRSAYNLGWVEIKRADKILESEPEQALKHLQTAIDWFNRAIRIRPKDKDARHNLEVVMRRAFELADSLKKADDEDFEQRIEQLIAEQRALQTDVGAIVELADTASEEDLEGKRFREQLRKLAVRQRQLLADTNLVFDDAANELQKLAEEQNDDSPAEEKQRAAQLSFVANYLQTATQRMGQARSQLRLRQQNRAFRRQAIALEELKGARDIFRDPAQRIRGLLQDAIPLHMQTMAYSNRSGTIGIEDDANLQIPAWLTSELLAEMQESLTARTMEFSQQIAAGVASMSESTDVDSESPPVSESEKQTWQAVSGHVGTATEKFESADAVLDAEQYDKTAELQAEGITELEQAEELLLDFRGLIERAFADQSQVQAILPTVVHGTSETEFSELGDLLAELQGRNVERTKQIARKLDEELTNMQQSADSEDQQGAVGDPQSLEKEVNKFRKAIHLAEQIEREMQAVADAVASAEFHSDAGPGSPDVTGGTQDAPDELKGDAPPVSLFEDAITPSKTAAEKLQELRRIFFTIVQRLQEAAHNQSGINDHTEQLTVLDDVPISTRGPIAVRQKENQNSTKQIGEELLEQANAVANSGNGPTSADQQAENDQATQNYQRAAELVDDASADMSAAELQLQVKTDFDLDLTRNRQQSALQKLIEAIELLQPPSDSNDDQDQSQDQEQDQDQQPSESDQQDQPQDNQASSLLQMIRDKEAKRRDEKAERARRLVPANGPDW